MFQKCLNRKNFNIMCGIKYVINIIKRVPIDFSTLLSTLEMC